MKDISHELRLLESGFPCHQVGAQTVRETASGNPQTHRLHVWWARRPLTVSRAAVQASLLNSSADPDAFIRDLGIAKKVAILDDMEWTLVDKPLAHVRVTSLEEILPLDGRGVKLFEA